MKRRGGDGGKCLDRQRDGKRVKFSLHKNSGLNHVKNRKRLLRLSARKINAESPTESKPSKVISAAKTERVITENGADVMLSTKRRRSSAPVPLKKTAAEKTKIIQQTSSRSCYAPNSVGNITREDGCQLTTAPSLKKPKSAGEECSESCQTGTFDNSATASGGGVRTLSKNQRRRLNAAKRRHRVQQLQPIRCDSSVLASSQFRYINEQLYTQTGRESCRMFAASAELFSAYHRGYQQQVQRWPVNPLDIIIAQVNRLPASHVIADLGCGEGRLALSVRQKTVHSFDLVSCAPHVRACDVTRLPLASGCCQCVVLCLALMSTDCARVLCEANRVLPVGGRLKIAEVASRIGSVDDFQKQLAQFGFSTQHADTSYTYFYLFRMRKVRPVSRPSQGELPNLDLKPCLYKRR